MSSGDRVVTAPTQGGRSGVSGTGASITPISVPTKVIGHPSEETRKSRELKTDTEIFRSKDGETLEVRTVSAADFLNSLFGARPELDTLHTVNVSRHEALKDFAKEKLAPAKARSAERAPEMRSTSAAELVAQDGKVVEASTGKMATIHPLNLGSLSDSSLS